MNISTKHRHIPFLFTCTIMLFISIIEIKAQGNRKSDSLALVDFYQATGGENWVRNKNWLSDKPISEWYGITLDSASQRVCKIELKNNNLAGSFPESFVSLDSLNTIRFASNKLTGWIPPFHTMPAIKHKVKRIDDFYEMSDVFIFNNFTIRDIYKNEEARVRIMKNMYGIYNTLKNQNDFQETQRIRITEGNNVMLSVEGYPNDKEFYYKWSQSSAEPIITDTPYLEYQSTNMTSDKCSYLCEACYEFDGQEFCMDIAYFVIIKNENTPPQYRNTFSEIDTNKLCLEEVSIRYLDDLSNYDNIICRVKYLPSIIDLKFKGSVMSLGGLEQSNRYTHPIDDSIFLASEAMYIIPTMKTFDYTEDSLIMQCCDHEEACSDNTIYFKPPPMPMPEITSAVFDTASRTASIAWKPVRMADGYWVKFFYKNEYDNDCQYSYKKYFMLDSAYISAPDTTVMFTALFVPKSYNFNLGIDITAERGAIKSETLRFEENFKLPMECPLSNIEYTSEKASSDQESEIYSALLTWEFERFSCDSNYLRLYHSINGQPFTRSDARILAYKGSAIINRLSARNVNSFYFYNAIRGEAVCDTFVIQLPDEAPVLSKELHWTMQNRKTLLKDSIGFSDDYTEKLTWAFKESEIFAVEQDSSFIYVRLKNPARQEGTDTLYFSVSDFYHTVDTFALFTISKANTPPQINSPIEPLPMRTIPQLEWRSLFPLNLYISDSESEFPDIEVHAEAEYELQWYVETPSLGSPYYLFWFQAPYDPGDYEFYIVAEDAMNARDSLLVTFTVPERDTNASPEFAFDFYGDTILRSEDFKSFYLPDIVSDDMPYEYLTFSATSREDTVWTEIINDTLYIRHTRVIDLPYSLINEYPFGKEFPISVYVHDRESAADTLDLFLRLANEEPKMRNANEVRDFYPGDTLIYNLKDYYSDDYTPFEKLRYINADEYTFLWHFNEDTTQIYIYFNFSLLEHNKLTKIWEETFWVDVEDTDRKRSYLRFKINVHPIPNTPPELTLPETITVKQGEEFPTVYLWEHVADDYTSSEFIYWQLDGADNIDAKIVGEELHAAAPMDFAGQDTIYISASDQEDARNTAMIILQAEPIDRDTVIDTEACGEYELAGKLLNESGTYCNTLKTVQGADSTITLHLNIRPEYALYDTVSIKEGEAYAFGGSEITSAGTFSERFKTAYGCDSIINLTVFVEASTQLFVDKNSSAIYPSMVHDFLHIDAGSADGKICIISESGNIVYESTFCGNSAFDMSQILQGMYAVWLITEKGTAHAIIVKQ